MGFIQDIFHKIQGIEKKFEVSDDPETDNITKDRYLRSLRRERRIQLEKLEKEQLKREIAEFKRNEFKQYVHGGGIQKLNIQNHMLKPVKTPRKRKNYI